MVPEDVQKEALSARKKGAVALTENNR